MISCTRPWSSADADRTIEAGVPKIIGTTAAGASRMNVAVVQTKKSEWNRALTKGPPWLRTPGGMA